MRSHNERRKEEIKDFAGKQNWRFFQEKSIMNGPALAQRAIEADIQGDLHGALRLYAEAINVIAAEMKKTQDPVSHSLLR